MAVQRVEIEIPLMLIRLPSVERRTLDRPRPVIDRDRETAYLAWIGLAGLVVNGVFGFTWADPLAALALVPFVIKEAREAYAGKCCC